MIYFIKNVNSDFTYEKIKAIADWIMSKVEIKPKIGIVCGSGLGGLGDRLENPCIIPYSDIPSFPKSTGIFIIYYLFILYNYYFYYFS